MTAGVQRISHRDAHERRSVLAGGCGHAARRGMVRGHPDEELAVNAGRAFAAQVIATARGFQIVPTHFQSPAAHVSADPCLPDTEAKLGRLERKRDLSGRAEALGPHNGHPRTITEVSIDMSPDYIAGVHENLGE
jgi:hypothetical protein